MNNIDSQIDQLEKEKSEHLKKMEKTKDEFLQEVHSFAAKKIDDVARSKVS